MLARDQLKSILCQGLLVALVAAGFYVLAPLGEKDGAWANTVLRNWHEHGLLNLQGKMVWNPGGVDVDSNPKLYGGHQPWVLYAAYFVQIPWGAPGDHGLIFFIIFVVAVWASILFLFAGRDWAPYLAWAAALSPGLLRSPLQLDTLAIPVPLGLAIFAIVNRLFAKKSPDPKPTALLGACLILGFYAWINWTTVFALGPMVAGWWVVWVIQRRQPLPWLVLAAFSVLAVCAVGTISLAGKSHAEEETAAAASRFFDTYLFGPGGYGGIPMTWAGAVRRIVFANAISLFPFWIVLITLWFRFPKKAHGVGWWSAGPFLVALLSLCGMRNYFATHPWMAGSVFVVGACITFWIRQSTGGAPRPGRPLQFPSFAWWPARIFCFFLGISFYCLLVALLLGFNSQLNDSLIRLVRSGTARPEIILFSAQRDPWIAAQKDLIEDTCDRTFVAKNDGLLLQEPARFNRRVFLLTSIKFKGPELNLWEERGRLRNVRPFGGPIDWYRRYISRRERREIFTFPEEIFLYERKGL